MLYKRTIAFVKFGTAECAEKVLRTMDGCLFGGFPIAVKPPRPNKHTGKDEITDNSSMYQREQFQAISMMSLVIYTAE